MLRLFLCGDVMTGRGIDQLLPHPRNAACLEAARIAGVFDRESGAPGVRVHAGVKPESSWPVGGAG